MPTAPPATTMTSATVAHARVQSENDGRRLRAGTRTGLNESCVVRTTGPLKLMRDSDDSDSAMAWRRGCVG